MTANRLPLLGWLFILGWLSAAAGSANPQPITPAPDGTNTVVTPDGNRYDISGGSSSPEGANLFHSFTEFGLSEGQTANFLTNPNIQNILGRITGGNPSLINGLIQVTGGNSNLFLMNPAGMIFGPSSSLNVLGSFNATTATGIGFGNNQWFSAIGNNNWATLIGTPNSFAFTSSQGGSIVNSGNLTVTPGESLSLVAGTVVNTGQLNAPFGNILISAVPGDNLVRISQAGNLLSLDIQPTATGGSLPNNWTQPVLSLPELLTGKGAPQATSLTVNPNGEVVLAGNVAVPGTAGTAIASGNLNVSGDTGGNVNILGEKVGVIAGNINANGLNGGGNVLIGGDYQGLGTVPNAWRTFVSTDSTINADAVSNGNGGRVIVWADETTRFKGNITARGGLFSGNGGFAEVSGKQSLDFQGLVDLRSTFGISGTLLLDPTDITISTGPNADGTFLDGAFPEERVFAPAGGTSMINNVTLQNQLEKGNVTISTESDARSAGDITVSAPVDWDNSNSLTLQANNNIIVNKSITNYSGNGALTLKAGNEISVNAKLLTTGGNISLTSTNDINTAAADIFSSALSLGNSGAISLSTTAGGNITTRSLVSNNFVAGGAPGNITLTVTGGPGAIDTTAGDLDSQSSLGNGGAIALSTAGGGNIITKRLVSFSGGAGTGGDITLTVTGGLGKIDTTRDFLQSSSTTGKGGAITLSTAGGNITTRELGSNPIGVGTGGDITLSVTEGTGAIDTSAGFLDSSSKVGNGGAITLSTADGKIITGLLNSSSSSSSPDASGGNIKLSVTGGTGAIDTTAGAVATSSQSGNGGAITFLTADGDIRTNDLFASSNGTGTGGNIKLSVTGGIGVIDTTNGSLTSYSAGGKGGAIELSTVGGNIRTSKLNSFSFAESYTDGGTDGGNIKVSVTGGTGAIDTTADKGSLNSYSYTGNGGAIELSTVGGNIRIRNLNSSSKTGNGGAITFSAASGTENIIFSGKINTSSAAGSGGNITFESPVVLSPVFLSEPTITLTTSGTTSSGNVAFNRNVDGTTARSEER